MLFLRTEQRLLAEIRRKRAQGYVDYAEVAAQAYPEDPAGDGGRKLELCTGYD